MSGLDKVPKCASGIIKNIYRLSRLLRYELRKRLIHNYDVNFSLKMIQMHHYQKYPPKYRFNNISLSVMLILYESYNM